MQEVLVYIILGIALIGLGRYIFQKWKNLQNVHLRDNCNDCPLKKGCKQTKSSCH